MLPVHDMRTVKLKFNIESSNEAYQHSYKEGREEWNDIGGAHNYSIQTGGNAMFSALQFIRNNVAVSY